MTSIADQIGFTPKIGDELWAWVTDVPGKGTSLIGVMIPDVGHTPLVFVSQATALLVERLARNHGKTLGQPVRLVHYRAVLE